jgi:hypothetical protein
MTVARFAVSFDPVLARRVRRSAGNVAISAWLADAANRKLRAEGLLEVVREWEREFGSLSNVTDTVPAAPRRAPVRKRSNPRASKP